MAAVLAIGVAGEGCAEVFEQNLEEVVSLVLPSFKDSHERVRWAACKTVGHLCSDFQPVLQKTFHEELVGSLLQAMDDRANPRVQSFAAAAIINFVQDADPECVLPHAEPLLGRLIELMQTNQSIVVEQAIIATGVVAACIEIDFIPFYGATLPLMKAFLSGSGLVDTLEIRGKSIAAIGLVASAVGLEVFRVDSQEIMEVLLQLEGSNLPAEDPRKAFLQSAWGSFAKALQHEFAPYLEPILPSILRSAGLQVEVKFLTDEEMNDEAEWQLLDPDQSNLGVSSAVVKEKAAAVGWLFVLSSELTELIYPHFDVILPICMDGLAFPHEELVRSGSALILRSLLRSVVQCTGLESPQTQSFVCQAVREIIRAIDQETVEVGCISLLEVLDEFMETGGNYLTTPEVQAVVASLEKLFESFMKQRNPHQHDSREEEDCHKNLDAQHDIIDMVENIVRKGLKTRGESFFSLLGNITNFFGTLLVRFSLCHLSRY